MADKSTGATGKSAWKGEAMTHDEEQPKSGRSDSFESPASTVSRRDFLRVAGAAGAAIGLGGGLGGLLAACGSSSTTTTTAGPATTAGATTTTGAATTASSAAATTTVSAAAEVGPEIRIGFVSPATGVLASFGLNDRYAIDRFREYVGDGQVLGDNKKHPITLIVQDSQSDSNRASQVAGDIINNSKPSVMVVASTPDSVLPVSVQAEVGKVPCFGTDCPWQPYYFNAPQSGWNYARCLFFGIEDLGALNEATWSMMPTNKTIGCFWRNDADGMAFQDPTTGMAANMKDAGLTIVDPGLYPPDSEDFTKQITTFKNAGCEIVFGNSPTPDFTNFWKQAIQQSFVPKICTVNKPILFPEDIESIGTVGTNICSNMLWSPRWPYKSYLTGETNQQWADEFTKRTGKQWSGALMHVVALEAALWTLRNAEDPTSTESCHAAASKTKFDGIVGPIDFTQPIAASIDQIKPGPGHPLPTVYKTPCQEGQWQKGTGKYPFEVVAIENSLLPDVAVEAKLLPITGGAS
jgi:branched-chain amino acid transport system substrate-binding protein